MNNVSILWYFMTDCKERPVMLCVASSPVTEATDGGLKVIGWGDGEMYLS